MILIVLIIFLGILKIKLISKFKFMYTNMLRITLYKTIPFVAFFPPLKKLDT
jgi:hypothetical protein